MQNDLVEGQAVQNRVETDGRTYMADRITLPLTQSVTGPGLSLFFSAVAVIDSGADDITGSHIRRLLSGAHR